MTNEIPNRLPLYHRDAAVAEAERRAVALWPRIAEEMGLPAEDTAFSMMLVNSSGRDQRAVLGVRTTTGQRFVLRAEFATDNVSAHMKHLERHRMAAQALRDVPGVNVPALLWQDETRPYALFEVAPGETAHRELTFASYGIADRASLLRRIGGAVAALHDTGTPQDRRFWPREYLREVAACATRVRAGDIALRKPKRFLGLCAMLHRFANRARGEAYRAVALHGDLHFRNILMTQDLVSFIDFSAAGAGCNHIDLVNLWQAKLPENLTEHGQQRDFGCVAAADWQAFESGYGQALTEDPVFQFIYLYRLYKVWRKLPPPGGEMAQWEQEAFVGTQRVFSWFQAHHPG
ncbi:aminoglycoside phosphotransferase family protein [Epibacterium sp. MM17-32]|uniref:aminoglycoside phosphotransferase family protein n=1 Tax=Epibacterium sp. MM17-32 TaxID=2917734 RepID=UPI001EF73123|nr:aminoglycoside phosphotransferase family protein [Epibacterium sp. MM17-32]MCG7628781.1 aminoglycoside phosphotransferase family protein [Epibacterium sp. MM17-32]